MAAPADDRAGVPSRPARRLSYLAGGLVGLLVSALSVWTSSYGAFNQTTSNGTNAFATATVGVTTDAPGTAVFSTYDLVPGAINDRCVKVTYTGSVAANVRLYGTDYTGDVGPYLSFVVSRGTGNSADCSDFVSGSGLFSDTFEVFGTTKTDFASGLDTWAPTASGQTRTYRIRYQLYNQPEAQERSGSVRLTWEAQA